MRILEIGIGLGLLAAVGALVSIYPTDTFLKWLLFGLGSSIFLGCLILEINEKRKASRLKAFNSFLDENILEGQKLMASNLESFCSGWDGKGNPLDDDIKKFEAQYKKWRKQVYIGCEEALGNKKTVPFNKGKIPKLTMMRWRRNNDYRIFLKEDIQSLKDFRQFTSKRDVCKKLK